MHTDARAGSSGPRAAEVARTGPGAAFAAVLAAGIGSFAVGFFVLMNEIGLIPAPSLYPPAGGVSGRTTFAVVAWLVAWGILHRRWAGRSVAGRPVVAWTIVLVALGLLATFPPLWGVF